jgi:hypothetical protein
MKGAGGHCLSLPAILLGLSAEIDQWHLALAALLGCAVYFIYIVPDTAVHSTACIICIWCHA